MTLEQAASGFDAPAQEGLPGPRWLAERRRAALEAFAEVALPTSAEEDWRYGRVGDLDLASFSPARGPDPDGAPTTLGADPLSALAVASGELAGTAAKVLETIGPRGGLVVGLDGGLLGVALGADLAATGARLVAIGSEPSAPEGLGERLSERADAFGLLAEAFLVDGVVLDVPAGARLERPVVIVHVLGPASEGRAVFPRTLVRLGEAAEATVIELAISGGQRALAVPVTEIDVGRGAHGVYLSAQELGPSVWHLGYQASRVDRDASLCSFAAAFGGDYARHWSRTTLVGDGAESQLFSVYLGRGSQTEEFRTFQDHVAPRTRSELVFKGAVTDRAHSVYTGLIRMEKGARRADASQTNRNLVLSEEAHAYSVPNLDIQENDVRCSHASAVGPIDVEQRFYLETRGVPSATAERLILLGFFEDLLLRSPDLGFAAHLRSVVTERLAIGGEGAGGS